jgi:hypothetical protein
MERFNKGDTVLIYKVSKLYLPEQDWVPGTEYVGILREFNITNNQLPLQPLRDTISNITLTHGKNVIISFGVCKVFTCRMVLTEKRILAKEQYLWK